MTTICWTVIHHAAAPFARGGTHVARGAHHAIGHIIRHVAVLVHRVASATPRIWIELVCKTVPAAVIGGGLLAPNPAGPPQPRAQSPPIVQPAPQPLFWLPPSATAPPPPITGNATPPGASTPPGAPASQLITYPPPVTSPPGTPIVIGPGIPPGAGSLPTPPENIPESSAGGALMTGVVALALVRSATRRSGPGPRVTWRQ